MYAYSYEEQLLGRMVDEPRPHKPSVIEVAKNVIGRDNFRFGIHGTYHVWEDGRWCGPLNLDDFIRAANRRLKEQGKEQIKGNHSWFVQ